MCADPKAPRSQRPSAEVVVREVKEAEVVPACAVERQDPPTTPGISRGSFKAGITGLAQELKKWNFVVGSKGKKASGLCTHAGNYPT